MKLQMLVDLIFPIQCMTCDEMVEEEGRLCPNCWSRTEFIIDHPCDKCGRPLTGDAREGDLCDDCLVTPHLWDRGRAALVYGDNARRIILGLKYGDRTEYAKHAAPWMSQRIDDLVTDETLVLPVPLHWFREMRRQYNQSALLGAELAKLRDIEFRANALQRKRMTKCLDGYSAEQRRDILKDAIVTHPKHGRCIAGREVLLVDDVLTTGATLDACAEVCIDAGAIKVNVVTLARVARRR